MSDPRPAPNPVDPRAAVGDALAEHLAETLPADERATATRDLVHEMIQAGAEEEVTPRLLADERLEEFTDAEYEAYEAAIEAEEAAASPPGPERRR